MSTLSPMDNSADALADAVFAAVKGYVEGEVGRLVEMAVEPLRQKVVSAPTEGPPGKDAPPVDIEALVAEVLSRIPVPKDGEPGPKGDPGQPGADGEPAPAVDTAALIEDVLKRIPPPKDGAPGPKGDPGDAGKDGANGKDGADGASGKDGAAGDPGPKGDPGEDGVSVIGPPGDPGREGRDGKDGKNGRDAAHIEVLDGIDELRSYARGTFAQHRGGLWMAFDTTDGMDGWKCVVRGIAAEAESSPDGGRTIVRSTVYSDGETFERSIRTRSMLHRGVYAEDVNYEPGDAVTWAGSLWHCDEATADKPGEGSKCWRLAVKRGRDGRDAR